MKKGLRYLFLLILVELVDALDNHILNDSTTVKDTAMSQEISTLPVPENTLNGLKSSELLFVQLVFRHGDRTPVILYPTDPNPVSVWEEGLGKLTKLGRKQHYSLGKYLHERYKDFATFSPNEVNVLSTNFDRTLRSAESHLAGLFAPSKEWKIDDNLNWQPITVQYIPKDKDRFLMSNVVCERAIQEENKISTSQEAQEYLQNHTDMFQSLSEYSGIENLDLFSTPFLFDTIQIEKNYNLKVPKWIEPFWEELENLMDLSYFWFVKTPVLKRLRTGPLTRLLMENMKKKIDGEIPNQKFQLFSSHDATVLMALIALDVFNMKHPPYCATVVYELHKMTDDSHALRLLYLNSTEPEKTIDEPHILNIPGCSEFCPFDYVTEYVKDIVPNEDEWTKECQLVPLKR